MKIRYLLLCTILVCSVNAETIYVANLLDDPSFTSNPDGSPVAGADIWSWKSGTKLMNFQSAGGVTGITNSFSAPIDLSDDTGVTGHPHYDPGTTTLDSITPDFVGANVRYAGSFADVTDSGSFNAWYEITLTNGGTVYTATSDIVNLFVGDSGDAAARQAALDTEILNWNTITWDTDPFAGGGIVYSNITGIGIQWIEETTLPLAITSGTAYFLFEDAPIRYSATVSEPFVNLSELELIRNDLDYYQIELKDSGQVLGTFRPYQTQGNMRVQDSTGTHCGVNWPHLLMHSQGVWLSTEGESDGQKLERFEICKSSGEVVAYRCEWRFLDYFTVDENHMVWFDQATTTQVHRITTELNFLRDVPEVTTTWVEFMTPANNYSTIAGKMTNGVVKTENILGGTNQVEHLWDGEILDTNGWIAVYDSVSNQLSCAAMVPLSVSGGMARPRINNGLQVDNIEIHLLDPTENETFSAGYSFTLDYLMIIPPDQTDWTWVDPAVADAKLFMDESSAVQTAFDSVESSLRMNPLMDDPSFGSIPEAGMATHGVNAWIYADDRMMLGTGPFPGGGGSVGDTSSFTAPITLSNLQARVSDPLFHPEASFLEAIVPDFPELPFKKTFIDPVHLRRVNDLTAPAEIDAWYEVTLDTVGGIYTATSGVANLFYETAGTDVITNVPAQWNTLTWDINPFSSGGMPWKDINDIGIEWFHHTVNPATGSVDNTGVSFEMLEARIKYVVTSVPIEPATLSGLALPDDPSFDSNPGAPTSGADQWRWVDGRMTLSTAGGTINDTSGFMPPVHLLNHSGVTGHPLYDAATATLDSITPEFTAGDFSRVNDFDNPGIFNSWYEVTLDTVGGIYTATSGVANLFYSNDEAANDTQVMNRWNTLNWDVDPFASGGLVYEDIMGITLEWFHKTEDPLSVVGPSVFFNLLQAPIRYSVTLNGSQFFAYLTDYGIPGKFVFEPDYDSDSDGWANLAEYGLGGDPTNGFFDGHVPAIGTSGGMLEIVHARRTDDASLIYSLEQTDELVNPAWTNAEYSVVGTNTLSGPFEEMINQVSTDSDQSFFRLELKQN
jgi:hypothetical protein